MRFPVLALMLATACSAAFAQGGSAVITLVMPPPGGDGYSALQTGAALPQGAASLYHNPALLAGLERSTGSQLFYTHSSQVLLPVLRLSGLSQQFQAVAVVAPDPENGADMAVGFFRNHVDFGLNTQSDASGTVVGTFHSGETVYGLGTAIRLGVPVSLGATAKYYDSDLATGAGVGAKDGIGWAFDFGVVANPRIAPPADLQLPALAFTPSLALVAKNIGPDVFYVEASQADPIPTTYTAAMALRLEVCDMLELTGAQDLDQEWTRNDRNWDPIRTTGFSAFFLAFRFSAGWLEDKPGKRSEKHLSESLEVNPLQLHRLLNRIRMGDFTSPSEAMDGGFLFRWTKVLGVPFRANPRLVVGDRRIESHDKGIRNGQKAFFIGVSL